MNPTDIITVQDFKQKKKKKCEWKYTYHIVLNVKIKQVTFDSKREGERDEREERRKKRERGERGERREEIQIFI